MSRWSEKRLLARIVSGEREACVELIRLYHAPIYRLLARLCGDSHLAEDLAQETFAAGWANMKTFNGDSSIGTWLHRIAYRKFVDRQRRTRRPATETADKPIHEAASPQPGPPEEAIAREQSRKLNEAVHRLKPPERDAVVLHYLHGLAYRDMARILDEPTGTLKWRTHQALENLRRLLKEEPDNETETTADRTSAPVASACRPVAQTPGSASA